MNELEQIAEYVNGTLDLSDSDGPFITIHTGDNTSKENYDDLIILCDDIESMLVEYEVVEKWADHDTQIITFN